MVLILLQQGIMRKTSCEIQVTSYDQSYFLWTLTQNQLKHVLFPVGHLQKDEVRKLAKKFGLPQATRKDSQGICFLGQVDMKEFLGRYVPPKRGDVLNGSGKVIGYHSGAIFFTIGERHGFTITKKTDNEVPLYVTHKDISKNTIIVASKITPHQKSQRCPLILKDVNFINGKIPSKNLLCRLRYRQEKQKCIISKHGDKYQIVFDKPQMGISPGQSLVLYERENCLGGGIIS